MVIFILQPNDKGDPAIIGEGDEDASEEALEEIVDWLKRCILFLY
jgi:hypothetical protein